MNRKFSTIFALLLAILMVFNCGAVVNADTSAGSGTDETTAQGMTYNGSEDISAAAVDSITINSSLSDGSVNTYTDFQVTVKFSEDNADGTQKSGLDIENGDTITVSWTAPDGVTFTGYKETINLYQNGDSNSTLLGTAEVTTAGVKITFNETVNNLQHVNGSVTFTIQNNGNPNSENGGTGTISSGNVTTNVTVNHSSSSGVVEFGSKGGSADTSKSNQNNWSIWINNGAQTNLEGNIVITDKLPDTETFLSFTSYAHMNGGEWNRDVASLDDFKQNGRSFVYDKAVNTITITIPASELKGIPAELQFATTSTAAAGSIVSNSISMEHTETGASEPYIDTYTGSLTVPSTSGSVSGVPRGTLQITKVVNNDTTSTLEGIYFHIYKVNSASDHTCVTGWYDGADYAEIVTGSDGVATLSGLDDGYYEIEEVTTNLPNWIATSDIKSVYVTIGGTSGTMTTISNSVKTGKITATKKWTQSDGATADTSDEDRTVYFQLYRDGAALTDEDLSDDQTAIQAVVTEAGESKSTVAWEELPLYDNSGQAYTYTVKEVDADGNDYTPSGYTKSEDGLTVTNRKNTSASNVTATKKWTQSNGTTEDTNTHPTIYFQLYRNGTALTDEDLPEDQTAIQAVKTASGESSATVTWTDLPDTDSAGQAYTYTVKEVDADGNDYTPSGYTKSEDGLTVTNKLNQQVVSRPSDQNTRGYQNITKSSYRKLSTKIAQTVKTGDIGKLAIWLMALLLSLVVIVIIFCRNRNNNH